jgi:hypothetical protein
VLHIWLLLFFVCLVPCYFCSDTCCIKRWLVNRTRNEVEKGVFVEIDKQSWAYNTAKDLETFQKLLMIKHRAKVELAKREGRMASGSVTSEADHKKVTTIEDEPMCYICYDNFKTGDLLVFLPCEVARIQTGEESNVAKLLSSGDGIDLSHIFHATCLKEQLETKSVCFICRAKVTKKTFETFYNYQEFQTFLNSSNQLRGLNSIMGSKATESVMAVQVVKKKPEAKKPETKPKYNQLFEM